MKKKTKLVGDSVDRLVSDLPELPKTTDKMANAKLHIICGNCGCSTRLKWGYEPEAYCNEESETPEVLITCENCSTIHALTDNAEHSPANH